MAVGVFVVGVVAVVDGGGGGGGGVAIVGVDGRVILGPEIPTAPDDNAVDVRGIILIVTVAGCTLFTFPSLTISVLAYSGGTIGLTMNSSCRS